MIKFLPIILLIVFFSCNSKQSFDSKLNEIPKLFSLLPSSSTNVSFTNQLTPTEDFNMYTYRNFYNGGGVGLGDVNNDGLVDIYFCGNMVDNKLYLNKGNFQFEDITEEAGVACPNVWSSGVSFADINGDGWLDLYVCKSGKPEGDNRYNELFINQGLNEKGIPTFIEKAKEYNIADKGLASHAAFFDYDKDGDLDCYLLNNSIRPVGRYDLRKNYRNTPDSLGGNKFYRNDGDKFTDVSQEVGIYSSVIGFGLGVTVGDVNRDGWQDIFVSNDFFERDYLYINQKNGKFEESLELYMREISLSSMGADMADINNDGFPEIFVTDMLPESDERMKTKTAFENWDKYQLNVKNGYFHQFTRNVLQLNNGYSGNADEENNISFSEIGRMAGVNATDWSWGALIFDMDNDGFKDLFVANGIYKDLTDQDYVNFYSDPSLVKAIREEGAEVIMKMMDDIPSEPQPNYAFINQKKLAFNNLSEQIGLGKPSFSNGSAYGDLDNDGDLDLVVNNVNMPSFIYENFSDSLLPQQHYLSFDLKGEGKNTYAIGTQVILEHQGKTFYQELNPMRGFLSTVDHRLHFGLGEIDTVDKVNVIWTDGKVTSLQNVASNQMLSLNQRDAKAVEATVRTERINPVFHEITDEVSIDYQHKENNFKDFDRDRLIYHMLSAETPTVANGDVNGDGLEDIFVGGTKGFAAELHLQQPDGSFQKSDQTTFEKDKVSENTDVALFDADGDGDLDLYLANGGNEFAPSSPALIDRLYINNGVGEFTKSSQILPIQSFESSSCVKPNDFDKDGDIDLFVGIRLKPFQYGMPVSGYLLQNDGQGNFKNITREAAPQLIELGMITDAIWADIDQDQDNDLIVVGDWLSISIFLNDGGKFTKLEKDQVFGSEESVTGWWNTIEKADLDNDGDIDFILGNHGENTRFKASGSQPINMHVSDFDKNGSTEQIISLTNQGKSLPLTLRQDLVMQLPDLKKKYLKYSSYKNQSIEDIYSKEQLADAKQLSINTTKSIILVNNGNNKFEVKPLPKEAQFAPIYAIHAEDYDSDGNIDLLLGGNFYRAKPEVGKYDASYGLLLKGDGKNNFHPLSASESGVHVKGEVREILSIQVAEKQLILVARNNSGFIYYEYNQNVK